MVADLQETEKVIPKKSAKATMGFHCVCASVPTCLVGMRTVHYDVRLWRGCGVLRHVRINGFFLAKENTIFRKEGNSTRYWQISSNSRDNAVSRCTNLRIMDWRRWKRGRVLPPPAGASARWVYGDLPTWLSSALCRDLRHHFRHGTSQSPRYGRYWWRHRDRKKTH